MNRNLLAVARDRVAHSARQRRHDQWESFGVAGESVVYVDAVQGKTFPAPTAHPADRSEGLDVPAAPDGGQVGNHRGLSEQRHSCPQRVLDLGRRQQEAYGTTWAPGRKGEKRSFKFDNPGAVPLLCNVHPEMSGYIVVSPTPYFAITDKSGELQDRERSGWQLHGDGVA